MNSRCYYAAGVAAFVVEGLQPNLAMSGSEVSANQIEVGILARNPMSKSHGLHWLTRRQWQRRLVGLAVAGSLVACAASSGKQTSRVIGPNERISFRDIDPAIWSDSPANRSIDPYQDMIQVVRDRKARDLANPNAPKPFQGPERIAKEFRASGAPWCCDRSKARKTRTGRAVPRAKP